MASSSSMASESRLDVNEDEDSYPLLSEEVGGSPDIDVEARKYSQSQNTRETPIPRGQLAALCAVRLVDPIAFTQIFPYVNDFMMDLHVTDDPTKVGFYSGLVESSFSLCQLSSIYQLAKLSDVIGRRPVIMVGIMGISIAAIFFGMSTSLTGVILARCLAGLFSGNSAVIHSTLGEITDSTNQHRVYPIYGLFWPLGAIVGPLIGGTLSHAATKFPQLFDYEIVRLHPYLVPCVVAAGFGMFSVSCCYLFLEETLPSKRKEQYEKFEPGSYRMTREGTSSSLGSNVTVKSLLSQPIVFALSTSGMCLSFIATAFEVVFVLFCYSPVPKGGLAFTPSQIGYSLACAGFIAAGIQLCIMPYLLQKFNNVKLYNFCMGLFPLAFLCLPLLNFAARQGYDETTGVVSPSAMAMVWIGIVLVLTMSRAASLAYSVSMILIKDYASGTAAFGATNGLVQVAMCLGRSISPAFVSSCFALTVDKQLLGGYLWVVIMVVIGILSTLPSRRIPQTPGNRRSRI